MAFTHSFSGTGKSPEFYGGRSGFDWLVDRPGSETISVTLEREINGVWVTQGSAKTADAATRISPGVDYTPCARFRISCDTFDTNPIVVGAVGDVFGDAVLADIGGYVADSWLLEDGTPLLLETGDIWLLEAA